MLGICNGFQILCEAGLLPGVLLPERVAPVRLPRRAVRVERADTPFTSRCERGAAARRSRSSTARALVRAAAARRGARARRQIVLRYAEARTRTARSTTSPACQRARQRPGPDAPPRARGRSAARLRRRRADPRVARRRRARARARARLSATDLTAKPKRLRKLRDAARARRAAAPHPARGASPARVAQTPSVVYAKRTNRSPFCSSSSTTDANRRSPARCWTVSSVDEAPFPTVWCSHVPWKAT